MLKYLKNSSIKNKTVLLRVDVNVPILQGEVADAFRIEQIVPTVELLLTNKNKVVICGHLGRPKGKEKEFSLKPAAEKLAEFLRLKFVETDHKVPDYHAPHFIFYTGDVRQEKHQKQIVSLPQKDVVMLENLRFYEGEEENDAMFSKKLAGLAEVYVNDAFGVDHRESASTVGVTRYLPCYAGLLLEKEIKSLEAVVKAPKKPFVLMMGGIKLSDKVETLTHLGKKADHLLLGGGIATLFFKAKGFEVGESKIEEAAVKTAWQLEKNFKNKIVLPLDVVVADKSMHKDSIRSTEPFRVGKNEVILDAGPKTILEWSKYIKSAKTLVWNGPLGLFEKSPFHHATMALARLIGGRGKGKAFAVVGGGETVDAVRLAHQFSHIDHVSTGGGAMLEFLAGKKLPGIEALK